MSVLDMLDLSAGAAPMQLVWPSPRSPVDTLRFDTAAEWRDFIGALGLPSHLPDVIQGKFRRAQTLYELGWLDAGLIKGR